MIPDKCQKMDGSTEALNVLFKCLCSLFISIVSVYSKGYHMQWPECAALVLGMLKNVILHMNTMLFKTFRELFFVPKQGICLKDLL